MNDIPEQPKSRSPLKQALTCLSVLLILLLLLGGGIAWWVWSRYENGLESQAGESTALVEFTIEPGQSVASIASTLEQEGLISDALIFRAAAKLQGKDNGISYGIHQLSPAMTLQEVLDELQNTGKKQEQWLQIKPGLRVDQVDALLAEQDLLKPGEFTAAAVNRGFDYPFLDSELPYDVPKGVSLEGFLYPDTYEFPENPSPDDILVRMLNNFQTRYEQAEIAERIQGSDLTFYDALILASIVQWEASDYEDMQRVAGVFLNRLDLGMRLDSDVTVLYALGDWKAVLDYDALQIDSPYNTRRYAGLPPGPISNPPMAALQAVLDPIESDDLYFLADRDGIIRYAKTYEDHLTNKSRYGIIGE